MKNRPLLTACLIFAANTACATDLMDVWRAARLHDLDYIAAVSDHEAGTSKHSLANALWRPKVQFAGTAGRMSSDTSTQGAQFSAQGQGTNNGVAFNTSINNGNLDRWTLSARQPLLNRDLLSQSRQLHLNGEVSELEWQVARQSLILRSAQRYFDVVMAQESLSVLQRQERSVEKSLGEIKLRFQLGDVPVTDSHEATARIEAIQAQVLSAESDLQLKLATLADASGLATDKLRMMQPAGALPATGKTLDEWLSEASQNNPELRIRQTRVAISREEATRYGVSGSPTLDLLGEVSRDHLTGSGDFGSASNTSRNTLVGVQLTIPLYTGGYRSARQDESLALAEKNLNEYERTRQQIALQIRSAWLGMTVGGHRIDALAASLNSSEARLAATRLGQKAGDRSTLDVLNAENDAANASLSWMQARITQVMDSLQLAALAGQLGEAQLQLINSTLQPMDKKPF